MAYLVYIDYLKQIQDANLTAILSTDQGEYIRARAERTAQEEISSYLSQRYDIAKEFKSTEIFSMSTKYRSRDLVYLKGDAWAVGTAYTTNQIVSKGTDPNNYVYVALQNSTGQDPVTATTYWKKLGTKYDLFYIPFPYSEFKLTENYKKNDKVYWNNKIYKAVYDTPQITHQGKIQYPSTGDYPPANLFPDNAIDGAQQWGTGVDYSITGLFVNAVIADYTAWSSATAYTIGQRVSYDSKIWEAITAQTNKIPGADITNWNEIYFVAGDNRSQQTVTYMIDIVLYHLHSRIAPRNIPQLRIDRYKDAKEWLDGVADGAYNANEFPLIQPSQGTRIRWGSVPKLTNDY